MPVTSRPARPTTFTLLAALLALTFTAATPADGAINVSATAHITVWADAHCWRYYWGSGYLVNGYAQSSASFSSSGIAVTGTVSASASSTGGAPDSDNGAADGVLTTGAVASAYSSGTPQTFAHSETAGASVRPSSPFPGLPSYVGGSMAFSCSTDSATGYDVTKSCDMTYTLNPVSLRWYRSAGSAGSCTVVG
jgi:hypothetical protein